MPKSQGPRPALVLGSVSSPAPKAGQSERGAGRAPAVRTRPACVRGTMEPRLGSVGPRAHLQARPPPPETLPRASWDEDAYDCPDYYYLRDFPASGAGRSKGRTRREQVLHTNRPVPGGHERKIALKILMFSLRVLP
nr:nuclear protein 2 [Cavia porcellus]